MKIKFIQIAVAHTQPVSVPNGAGFQWEQTTLYALDSDGQIWSNFGPGPAQAWSKIESPDLEVINEP